MSPKKSVSLTLVDSELAEVGYEFITGEMDAECRDCNLMKVCSQLEKNMRYRIISVREKQHDCKAVEGKVNIVEVEKADIPRAITKDDARGSAVEGTWRSECNVLGCQYDNLCFPEGIRSDKKYEILSIDDEYTCPELGTKLVKAVVKEIEGS